MQNDKPGMDPEAMLSTLHQMTQTINTLSETLTRLEKYVQAHANLQQQSQNQSASTAAKTAPTRETKKVLH
jgi:hypothetical protein